MKYTFHLRKPKSDKKTLILFSCYFNDEKKKFVYSTKRSILPSQWDFENKCPRKTGKNTSYDKVDIAKKLREFEDAFYLIKSRSELSDLRFNSSVLKDHFDKEFHRATTASSFFDVYDKFLDEKIKLKEWKYSTLKRYKNIKNILLEFEKVKKYKLTFSKVDKIFYIEFTDFSYEYRDHCTNTFSRNVGLFKTFMYWATENNFNFNKDFIEFKKPKRVITRQEAMSLEQLKMLHAFDTKNEKHEEAKDIFIFQCLTGMRHGELKFVNKRNVIGSKFMLKEEKDTAKPIRDIPLTRLALEILEKYNYLLPLKSNQKRNGVIKEILKSCGFDHDVEYTIIKGVEQETIVKSFYERISTHAARRSFITIMRNQGAPDKTIMSITGHKDFKTFNMYHQVNDSARMDAVNKAFNDF